MKKKTKKTKQSKKKRQKKARTPGEQAAWDFFEANKHLEARDGTSFVF